MARIFPGARSFPPYFLPSPSGAGQYEELFDLFGSSSGAMGMEQHPRVAAREVLASAAAREWKDLAARARAWALKLRATAVRGEKAATVVQQRLSGSRLPEEERFAAPNLAGRSSTGPNMHPPPPKIDRRRNLPGHPKSG